MSVSLLPGIISAAIVRVKAVMAVWTPLTLVPRSLAIELIATFIVVAAKLHRNCASTSGISIPRASAAVVTRAFPDEVTGVPQPIHTENLTACRHPDGVSADR